MKISVIVPNHNRDITRLTNSLPASVELVHINRGLERSEQRNIGIQRATGDAYLFLDSDQSISPCLIKECIELTKWGYDAIYIPEVIIAESFFGKIRKFEREFYTGTAVDVPRFVVKNRCPLFDEGLNGPEDSDWGHRINGIKGVSTNVLYHHDDIGIREYFRKKRYYARSMQRYREKWPHDPILKFSYRCWKVFTEKGKWRKLIRHPLLSFGIFIIIGIRGIIYVTR